MNILPKVLPEKKMPEVPENWKNIAPMKAELEKAGFEDVEGQEVQVEMQTDSLEIFIDFILDKMPHTVMMLKDVSAEDKARVRERMMEEGRKLAPTDPVNLKGVALVAVGRK